MSKEFDKAITHLEKYFDKVADTETGKASEWFTDVEGGLGTTSYKDMVDSLDPIGLHSKILSLYANDDANVRAQISKRLELNLVLGMTQALRRRFMAGATHHERNGIDTRRFNAATSLVSRLHATDISERIKELDV